MSQTMSLHDGKHIPAIKRWYDLDAQLGDLVRVLEELSPESQGLFAYMVKKSSERIIQIRGREFFRRLDWTVFLGLVKSKRSRRWYDQEPTLHLAFNTLYSLSDGDKALIGHELNVPAQLVKGYEHYCQTHQAEISLDMVQCIVETCIKEGHSKAQEIYSIFN